MNITLRQLKIFAAVAKNNSFTRAAEELNLTQPAVSMQVKQLEDQAGIPLFEQVGKKIFLTEAGEEVLHYSRAVAGQLDEMASTLNSLKGLAGGRLRIAIVATANYFAPRLLGAFGKLFPGIGISLDVHNRQSLLDRLKDNDVDMAIMGRAPADLELEAESFMENPLVIIAPPDHRLAGEADIPLKRLEEEVFLARESGSGTRKAMEEFFDQHGITIANGMEVSSVEAIKQCVQAGLGLGLMSRDAIRMELTLGSLVVLDVSRFPIMRHWFLVHRKSKRLSAPAEAFKRFVLANTTPS
ncbi:MAG: transcriptional regulator [Rhodospirillales bacterium RIFCSPLOWO2_12_FULL_58_28]|nr:MAG: transcriptional regulator [Rhodospirillales bacterium RIFCSPLOWO2_02_FULL_58_16]OHC79025.1 MAG: transcriptional regulator [Rhodospirillales bacterium RIFCSPLOWO2_12_FULL_58_28]